MNNLVIFGIAPELETRIREKVKKWIKEELKRRKEEGIEDVQIIETEEDIIKQVSNIYNNEAMEVKNYPVTVDDVKGQSRKQYIKEARQLSMFLIKKNKKYSLAKIGSFFNNKDHATVLWSLRVVENLLSTNQLLISKEVAESLVKKYKKKADDKS